MYHFTEFESTIYVILQMDFLWAIRNDVSDFDFTCWSIYLWTNEKWLLACCKVTSCILTVLKADGLWHLEDGGSAFLLNVGRVRLKPDGTRWRTGEEVKGKLANGVGRQYSHPTSERGVSSITTADAHTSAASSRLNWRPRRFKRTRSFRRKTKSFFRACAITFQTQSTFVWDYMTSHRTKQRPPFTVTSTSNLKRFGRTKSCTLCNRISATVFNFRDLKQQFISLRTVTVPQFHGSVLKPRSPSHKSLWR